ncbi:MAG: ComEA family DNA-binding protein [Desulfomonilaceae bacterium]
MLASFFSLVTIIWACIPNQNILDDSHVKHATGDCGYQIIRDGKVLGTLFFDKRIPVDQILGELGENDLSDRCKSQVFPCNTVLVFCRDGSLMDARQLSGAQIVACGKRLDLNSVSEMDIQSVPGIGPGLAKRIMNRRRESGPFESLDDLAKIKGIGSKKVSDLKIYLKLNHETDVSE